MLKVFSFILIPLYTSYLSPEQYGIINLSMGFVSFISCLTTCGLQYAVVRFYADTNKDENQIKRLFSSIINFLLIISFGTIIILLSTRLLWTNIVFDNINSLSIILLTIVLSCLSGMYYVYQELLRGMQRARESIILTYVYFFLILISNIIVVVILELGALGVIASSLLATIIMIAIMFKDLFKHGYYSYNIDWMLMKSILKYSLPLVPHTMAFNISNLYSRIIINTKMSTSMLGLFSLASQFAMVADQVSNSVQSAFQPWLYQKLNAACGKNENSLYEIRNLTTQLLWAYGEIYLVIGAWGQQAIDIMAASSYHSAWQYVPVFIMSVAIKSPLYFYQNFMYYYKDKTKYVFLCTISGCSISMILVWFWVPTLGIYGAIFADIIALIFRLCLTKWILRSSNTIYSFSKVIGITIFAILWLGLTLLPSYFIFFEKELYNTIYKTLMILSYLSIIIWKYRKQAFSYVNIIKTKFK